MKLELQPTDRIERVEGTLCRVWSGATETGVPVHAYIAVVQPQTLDPAVHAVFAAELEELPYRRELVCFDIRMAT